MYLGVCFNIATLVERGSEILYELAVVKILLDTGTIDVDVEDTEYGLTPLWWAAGNGHDAVVKVDVEYHTDRAQA